MFYVAPVKSKVEILENFVAFSEYMNFKFLYQNVLYSMIFYWKDLVEYYNNCSLQFCPAAYNLPTCLHITSADISRKDFLKEVSYS